MFHFRALPPLSLYIHFPWCVKKCPYCDFNSHELKTTLDEKNYIAALLADLEQELPFFWGRSISSIFMGGGTPSLFSAESMDTLLSGLRARLNLAADIEITLEANPGTLEQGRFAEFRAAGINRLSIGIQSFNDAQLQKLGRIHDSKQAITAAEQASASGFDSFNLDLMYGLPGQDMQQALTDLQTAIDLQPPHLSHYQLTIEPNTLFYHHPPITASDDQLWEMQQQCQALLHKHGYQHYEISAYAKTGHQCRHNLNYWQFGDYIGIGAGAHGKLSRADEQSIVRSWKVRHPNDYLQHAHSEQRIAGTTTLKQNDAAFEFMMNALRLSEGFATELFQQHCGLPVSQIQHALQQAQDKGWIDWQLHHIRPTARGQQYLNNLLELFVPE